MIGLKPKYYNSLIPSAKADGNSKSVKLDIS